MSEIMFNVLIVDDEFIIREGIVDGIDWKNLGCEVPFVAKDGFEAVGILKTTKIDIVITDIKMPGMDGLELAKWIKENDNKIETIILTGYDDFKFAQSAIKYGVSDFILKPTKLEEIEEAIQKIKKKIIEQCQKQKIHEESKKIVEENKRHEKNKIINSLIFNRIENAQDLRQKLENADFNPHLQRMAVLELRNNYKYPFVDNSILYYIEYIERKINDKIENTPIQLLSQFEEGRFILFFFSQYKNMEKKEFCKLTENMIKYVENDIKNFFPFNVGIGLSYVDKNIYNIKELYWDAIQQSDKAKIKNCTLEELDNNIIDILSKKYKEYINQKDITGIGDEIDNLFYIIRDTPIVYLKSVAIEVVNYTLSLIDKNDITDCICKEKTYAQIIKLTDIRDIKAIVKDTLRKICLNMNILENDAAHNDAAHNDAAHSELSERIIAYLKINFFNDLTLQGVAYTFHISPGHLCRIIKKSYGKTFNELLTQIRVENAKVLLKNPRFKIYEVADAVGFKDSKYFSQVFKKHTGKTPSEFK